MRGCKIKDAQTPFRTERHIIWDLFISFQIHHSSEALRGSLVKKLLEKYCFCFITIIDQPQSTLKHNSVFHAEVKDN